MKTDFNFNTNQPICQSVASLIILSFYTAIEEKLCYVWVNATH